MKIRDLFVADVTRDIPPVVYFHEQSPEKLWAEVSQYIITGGYPAEDPRALRVKTGIHEQLVALLRGIEGELAKSGGPELPAAWISGFYGSGKSSFAKLLGLALDGVQLPDGTPLSRALLERDDSPRRQELFEAWDALVRRVNPIAVVFDIGSVARDGEPLHAAVSRLVQKRLGYCSKSDLVADFELRLKRDGEWEAFVSTAKKTLGKPWSVAKEEEQAEEHFSHVLHVMKPDRYTVPMAWLDSRAAARAGAGTSVREAVENIGAMLHLHDETKSLFIVVDEVSQYIQKDEGRMLKLQSFVAELGQKLNGRVWLFATGQQKLEDTATSDPVGKLKDRFPAQLRVHLSNTNIRDVVHNRLLKKNAAGDRAVRDLFNAGSNRANLKLYAYGCAELTEQDFAEAYPLLPGHIDLLMQITSSLRARATRAQGDDQAIRGVLQLLGALFREHALAAAELGQLVTLDAIFEVQRAALDADIQTTLGRLFDDVRLRDDELVRRVAKAVALLELVQEQIPTTPELVASCLYSRLGEGNRVQAVGEALEKLRGCGFLGYSEKHGFKLQSSLGQEWQRERDDIAVTEEQLGRSVQEALKSLVGAIPERPRWKGRNFQWALWFSDGRQATDVKLQDAREDSTVAVDFRLLGKEDERDATRWVPKSAEEPLKNRLVCVAGDPGGALQSARQLVRSEHMLTRYRPRRESLSPPRQRLLIEEEARRDELEGRLRMVVAEAFLEGAVYFRGQRIRPQEFGSTFGSALSGIAARMLPELYPHFSEIVVHPKELVQLLEKELNGPPTKFMDGQLGILSLDSGKYVASCTGLYPARVAREIQQSQGLSGQDLITIFSSPPYGYSPELLKACCAGLLRGKKIRIRTEQGADIQSHEEPGVRDLFSRDRDFRRAELFPAAQGEVTQRDRIAIRKLFEKYLQVDQEPDDESIADTTFRHFPVYRERLRELERRFDALPGRAELPPVLQRFDRALEDACRSRFVQSIVSSVRRNLEILRDGFEQLVVIDAELTPEVIALLGDAGSVLELEISQLRAIEELGGLEEDASLLVNHLAKEYPYRDATPLAQAIARIRERYVEVRSGIINRQNVEVEAARTRIKLRAGFSLLDADQVHRVLRPIGDVLADTSPEERAPSLSEIRERFRRGILSAEEAANERLDEVLSRQLELHIVRFETRLRGREISSREQLQALLKEMEDRIGPLLDEGARVRFV